MRIGEAGRDCCLRRLRGLLYVQGHRGHGPNALPTIPTKRPHLFQLYCALAQPSHASFEDRRFICHSFQQSDTPLFWLTQSPPVLIETCRFDDLGCPAALGIWARADGLTPGPLAVLCKPPPTDPYTGATNVCLDEAHSWTRCCLFVRLNCPIPFHFAFYNSQPQKLLVGAHRKPCRRVPAELPLNHMRLWHN
jgi:hypothetical protein